MNNLIRESWEIYNGFEKQPFLVKPSIPILFFGDSDKYFSSRLRIITLGLNPSRSEFPDDNRFLRFGKARNIYPQILDGIFYDEYLEALNGYFQNPPNRPYGHWFNSFEPLLNGLDCSYYGQAQNTALHTDLCSPLATDPTWSRLDRDTRSMLIDSGTILWHRLVKQLSPDLIIASIARRHLDRIAFPWVGDWRVVHTVERANPYHVQVRRLRVIEGKDTHLVFGRAANTPFGTISNMDKQKTGIAIKEYVYAE
jgi:hypothetical protein